MASPTSSSEEKKVILISSDKQSFEISESAALLSRTIKNYLGVAEEAAAAAAAAGIPLQNVDSKTLVNVIEFCKRHAAGDNDVNETLKEFNKKFIEPLKRDELINLVQAANYMDIKPLLDVAADAIADKIKNLSVKDCREYFNIVGDYNEEEERKLRKENEWAHELDPIDQE